ncbi:hypothetical protein D3C81_1768180 [compost metagenome]
MLERKQRQGHDLPTSFADPPTSTPFNPKEARNYQYTKHQGGDFETLALEGVRQEARTQGDELCREWPNRLPFTNGDGRPTEDQHAAQCHDE